MHNPSALQGAKANMRHLGQVLGLRGFVPAGKEQRNNIVLYEDGGGYIPTKKAIDNSYIDPFCQTTYDCKQEFLAHFFESHPDVPIPDLSAFQEFRDFCVELGGGHYELNVRRNCLSDSEFYDSFVRDSMIATGFSEVQARYQACCRDNHK